MSEFVQTTSIPGLLVLRRTTHSDSRGYFREVFHLDEIESQSGIPFHPVQMNHSHSIPGVIRALHAENWNKLVYPVSGEMFSVIVDIRPDSPTFSQVQTFSFSPDDKYALFIPPGLANSICVTGDQPVDYIYLVDKYYLGTDTRAIAWDDPDLHINWPIKNPIISDRDRKNPRLRTMFPDKFKKV
jgi:dTDP-4-dehydrorhamnose 3,5-epimerase